MPYHIVGRTALALAWALFSAGAPSSGQAQESRPTDALDSFLKRNVSPLRSLSPSDEDFSDLEPLARAIGDTRIVQIGEQSHGSGGSFEARVRLIKFLHQRMGFDVLVWESGMHETRLVNAALKAGTDPSTAAAVGIPTIWAASKEAREMLVYAQSSLKTARPLEMAGFDMQFMARGAEELFRDSLLAFVRAVPDPIVRANAVRRAGNAFERYERVTAFKVGQGRKADELTAARMPPEAFGPAYQKWITENHPRLMPAPQDLELFNQAVDSLSALIIASRTSFLAAHTAKELDFYLQALQNFRAFGQSQYESSMPAALRSGPETIGLLNAGWERRDTQNARNMLWLARKYYAGRKLIVWAHTAHVMNAYQNADHTALAYTRPPGGTTTTGKILGDSIPDDIYTIAMVAYQGRHGWVTMNTVTDLPPAPVGTLEERIHRLGYPFAFLDLKQLRGRSERTIMQNIGIRLSAGATEMNPDWLRAIDAVIYLDTDRPATRWRPPG